MSLKDLRDEIADEVGTILASDFTVEVTATKTVPHSNDPAITFPNLDGKTQKTKLIDTCVLYIDIRRSTELNLTHKPKTVSKLYSAFVRAMTRCARHHHGHVRGIIGDRVMVIFDQAHAFANAVECAISMNTISQHVINRYFKNGEVECGIGIDSGKMLATKTGVRRRGAENHSYRNLVWLGRPANVASKLTDLANKPPENLPYKTVSAGYIRNALAISTPANMNWQEYDLVTFLGQFSVEPFSNKMVHFNPNFRTCFLNDRTLTMRPKTEPILMTKAVWDGYCVAKPDANIVKEGMFQPITLQVPGYNGPVFSGNVIYPALKA